MPDAPAPQRLERLDPAAVAEVVALTDRAAAVDGVSPLNDDARLALHRPSGPRTHLLLTADGTAATLLGYAQVEPSGDGATAVLAVDPDHRRQGHGARLVAAARDAAGPEVAFWAFRDLPAARALAAASELVPVRTLLMMAADLTAEPPAPAVPDGIAIRAFVPGQDDEAWLAVNAAAFAHHPEQGRMTRADLQGRMAEDWFDPADFLLAVATDGPDAGAVQGFHWTKRHSATRGEVYVLGVDPGYDGRGLGTALLLAGLRRLHEGGAREVVLYVEAEHDRAVRLYDRHGFRVVTRDVMYAPPSGSPVTPGAPEEN